jgi:hypothetical protein
MLNTGAFPHVTRICKLLLSTWFAGSVRHREPHLAFYGPSEVPMTALKLDNLVLNGVRVVVDNVTGLVRLASTEAGMRGQAVVPLVERHLPSNPAMPESDTRPRYNASNDGGHSAPRAGRLAGSAGVPHSRIPPQPTGPAYLAVGPKSKSWLLHHPWQRAQIMRPWSGRGGEDFEQPSTTQAFTLQPATARSCPRRPELQARMPRVVSVGRQPGAGR